MCRTIFYLDDAKAYVIFSLSHVGRSRNSRWISLGAALRNTPCCLSAAKLLGNEQTAGIKASGGDQKAATEHEHVPCDDVWRPYQPQQQHHYYMTNNWLDRCPWNKNALQMVQTLHLMIQLWFLVFFFDEIAPFHNNETKDKKRTRSFFYGSQCSTFYSYFLLCPIHCPPIRSTLLLSFDTNDIEKHCPPFLYTLFALTFPCYRQRSLEKKCRR